MRSWLKPGKVLNDRQLSKIKTSSVLFCGCLIVQATVVAATYWYNGEEFEKTQVTYFPRGRIVEYTNLEEFCDR